ncbi:unnamed protein product [Lepeophtheirus salmonis]|uniref:(salmon louse) hypothetical protein n=1 Tax=Lepeophtheirus salmonis TaxID=72036 RepID=A0A7R8CC09_LEPSM|nr:unnamed protein product [Lepeophtheirus salmonis]CAF2758366.1 unnamed protein product [Lepeophtheirus salmonis]
MERTIIHQIVEVEIALTPRHHPSHHTGKNARGYDHGISGQKVIDEIGLTDKDLIRIKTKDLNQLLKGVSKNRQKEIKSERRTYKNRIYADNCRKKRLHEKEQLEIYLGDVTQDIEKIQQEIHKNRYKTMGYIKSCDTLLRSLDKYESGPEMKKKIKDEIWKENRSELKYTKELFDKLGERDFEKT